MNLVTFCASHINNADRLNLFENLVRSVQNQVVKTTFFVSLSYEECVRKSVKSKLSSLRQPNIKIFVQRTKMSQFEHYKFLCEQIDPIFMNRTWCLFTDDDDYLSPLRNKTYMQMLKTSANEVCVCNRSILFASWSDKVTKQHLNRHLIVGKDNARVSCSDEYVCYCVKLSLLKRFCYFMSSKGKLKTNMCDLVFGSMLHILCKTISSGNHEWVYAYNQNDNHSRICKAYDVKYYVEMYDEKLFDDLASEFKFKWLDLYPKGYSFTYSLQSYKDALATLQSQKDALAILKKTKYINRITLKVVACVCFVTTLGFFSCHSQNFPF